MAVTSHERPYDDVDDPDALRDKLMEIVEDELARYRLPHYIRFVNAETFGRSATTKVVRAELENWEIDPEERVREI
jgi:acyl-coenzyme A synthetase/AMP-(fatty) acid ligase